MLQEYNLVYMISFKKYVKSTIYILMNLYCTMKSLFPGYYRTANSMDPSTPRWGGPSSSPSLLCRRV